MSECKHKYGALCNNNGDVFYIYEPSVNYIINSSDVFKHCPDCGTNLFKPKLKKYKVTGKVYIENPTFIICINSIVYCKSGETALTKTLEQVGNDQATYALEAYEVKE